jgi:hypothetical protein
MPQQLPPHWFTEAISFPFRRRELKVAEIDARFPGLIATILKAHKLQSEGQRSGRKARARGLVGKPALPRRSCDQGGCGSNTPLW